MLVYDPLDHRNELHREVPLEHRLGRCTAARGLAQALPETIAAAVLVEQTLRDDIAPRRMKAARADLGRLDDESARLVADRAAAEYRHVK